MQRFASTIKFLLPKRFQSSQLSTVFRSQPPVQPAFKFQPQKYIQSMVYNLNHYEPVEIIDLPTSVFKHPIRPDIMHQVLLYHLGQKRGVVQYQDKDRTQMRGSGRKLRPQKGMGRARISDRRSPVMFRGGKCFPRKTKDYRINIQSKVLTFGFKSALSSKYAQNQFIVVEDVPKTALNVNKFLQKQNWECKNLKWCLVDEQESDLAISVDDFNVYEILLHDYVFVTKGALNVLLQKLA